MHIFRSFENEIKIENDEFCANQISIRTRFDGVGEVSKYAHMDFFFGFFGSFHGAGGLADFAIYPIWGLELRAYFEMSDTIFSDSGFKVTKI